MLLLLDNRMPTHRASNRNRFRLPLRLDLRRKPAEEDADDEVRYDSVGPTIFMC